MRGRRTAAHIIHTLCRWFNAGFPSPPYERGEGDRVLCFYALACLVRLPNACQNLTLIRCICSITKSQRNQCEYKKTVYFNLYKNFALSCPTPVKLWWLLSFFNKYGIRDLCIPRSRELRLCSSNIILFFKVFAQCSPLDKI